MSQLIHVGINKLSEKPKLYQKIKKEVLKLFDEKYPDPYEGYFQHIPLEDLSPDYQEKIKTSLKEDIHEYAFNYLSTCETQGPILKLSGLGDVKFVRQSAYNEAFEDPTWEFEANGVHNMSSSITTIWHLNDVEENGELEFLFQEVRIRPQDKEIVTFPSYYTHSHKLIPATKEKLFLITTFYLGG